MLPADITYEASLEIFLERINADVWTIESKHNGHQLLPRFGPYKGKLNKKIAVGMISHRALQVETVDEVAADIRLALEHIEPEHLVLSSDCGFGRQGVPRPIAFYKAAALAQGANIVRAESGVPRPRSVPRTRRYRSTCPLRHRPRLARRLERTRGGRAELRTRGSEHRSTRSSTSPKAAPLRAYASSDAVSGRRLARTAERAHRLMDD